MNNKNESSLAELLISMIIAAILFLTIGSLSSIANSSYNKINKQKEIYNDISYGFKLMQNRVRGAVDTVKKETKPNPPWVGGEWLVADSAAFGLYKDLGNTNFVYLANKNDESKRETIFSVPGDNLNWKVTCQPSCTSLALTLSGNKDNIQFDMGTTILRRN